MSHPTSDSAALPPPDERWTNRRFVLVLLLVVATHAALVFLFGTKKQIVPVPAGGAPHFQLVDNANELVALSNPTLFARPNPHDFVSAFWRAQAVVPQPSFDWSELPHFLDPGPGSFGSVFHEFVENSRPAEFPLEFKPEPILTVPDLVFDNPVPPATTMIISDELAPRRLLDPITPPSWPRNDVIEPSIIQVLVDAAGNVYSTVVLKTSKDPDADQEALQLVRGLRFAPAPQPTIGAITFYWHTVPTNAPSIRIP
ncbi:MAG: TonB family protein [Verrucomicrobiota bacterium]|jgi:TonB family protein